MLEREEVLKQCQLKAVEGGERIEDQLVDALRQVSSSVITTLFRISW